ncbi:hypothetical protein LZU96_20075 (plasmid) [Pantoea agglomerans]|uniref:hypothetical protein n=1 Tax=Enterobacter agglomerans TaxID=549 RepID=UPI001F158028|nr:hypothetical protein [Pantoea agglomerans]UIL54455.1 hypothetical protein LZU96_20075 [Pantoea agglomerans]
MTDDAGNPIADGTTTNDSTPTFGGEGMQPGSTVTITDGETVIGEVTADDDGQVDLHAGRSAGRRRARHCG